MEPNALTPISDWLTQVLGPAVVYFVIFALGTVQGTQLIKLILPTKAESWFVANRPKLVYLLSMVVGLGGVFAFGVDFIGIFKSLGVAFNIDPVLGQLLSGMGVTLAANSIYDKNFNK